MSVTVTLLLDDATAAYLERLAADQERTPAEVAAWIVTEDLRREQAIDAELVTRLDAALMKRNDASGDWSIPSREVARREGTGA